MKRGHFPIRTCRGCGRRVLKMELVRLAMVKDVLIEDLAMIIPGRGIYCCKKESCRAQLEKNKKMLRRAFRLKV